MAYKTITIVGTPNRKEFTATAVAITPGFLVELATAGTVQAHSSGGATAAGMFAIEDENQGKEIADNYAVSALIQVAIYKPGDEVYALLADGETAVINSFLESNGDGYLRVVDADASAGEIAVHSIVGIALEAVDMSGSAGVDPAQRIRIMII